MIEKYDLEKKKDHPLEFFEITTVDDVTMEGWIVKPKNLDKNKKYPVYFIFIANLQDKRELTDMVPETMVYMMVILEKTVMYM